MPPIVADWICVGKEKGMLRIEARPCVRLRNVAEAARRFGCSHSHLSRVLKGERTPSKELARKMGKLGIKPVKGAVV